MVAAGLHSACSDFRPALASWRCCSLHGFGLVHAFTRRLRSAARTESLGAGTPFGCAATASEHWMRRTGCKE